MSATLNNFCGFVDIIFDKDVIKMTERIEKIERVQPLENDAEHKFEGRSYRNARNTAFLNEYRRFLRKNTGASSRETSGAYNLEITNAGLPALFYFGDSNIRELLA